MGAARRRLCKTRHFCFFSLSRGARGGGLNDSAARLIVLKQTEKGGGYVDKNRNFQIAARRVYYLVFLLCFLFVVAGRKYGRWGPREGARAKLAIIFRGKKVRGEAG